MLEKTVWELRGQSCLLIEEAPPPKQQIIASRSFGKPVSDLPSLRQAVSSYTARAAEKLRSQHSQVKALTVFLNTPFFRDSEPQYHPSITVRLYGPSQDTRILCQAAGRGLEQIYRAGYRYQKAGVMLLDIASADQGQQSLFYGADDAVRPDRFQLMRVLDDINRNMGRDTLWLAGQGLTHRERQDSWRMNRKNLSPAYTTQWSDLPVVHAF